MWVEAKHRGLSPFPLKNPEMIEKSTKGNIDSKSQRNAEGIEMH